MRFYSFFPNLFSWSRILAGYHIAFSCHVVDSSVILTLIVSQTFLVSMTLIVLECVGQVFVECSQFCFVWCFSHDLTGLIHWFREEDHRGDVPFLTHHIEYMWSTWFIFIFDHLAKVVLARFLNCTVVFPLFSHPLEVSH